RVSGISGFLLINGHAMIKALCRTSDKHWLRWRQALAVWRRGRLGFAATGFELPNKMDFFQYNPAACKEPRLCSFRYCVLWRHTPPQSPKGSFVSCNPHLSK
ncbi:MAG: hypothetical protein LK562_12665, partial [Candidatus Accumulibacter phosphatis]|nr:hypothetical protein [Candidatus Accumulibacter phosphatis]